MADHARSDHPAVQSQLDRLAQLSPGSDVLGLSRISELLKRLDHPERHLPPIFHVAGTNGKGSTCAFLRAAMQAAGLSVHVYTSPHLVRFNERIRIADKLIDDETLAAVLKEVLDVGEDVGASFFEVTTAAAFLAFSRKSADACIIEVGLGGKLDATNVILNPVACGIAQLGVDHQFFLGNSPEDIAEEKAGIAKEKVPLLTQNYAPNIANRVKHIAEGKKAIWLPRGGAWEWAVYQNELHYRDEAGMIHLPLPRLNGSHQNDNAALAVAMLRHQKAIILPESAYKAAMGWASWPARLQHLSHGHLVRTLPVGAELWIDGCHNPAAAPSTAAFFQDHVEKEKKPFHLIMGMLANKDAEGVLQFFSDSQARFYAVPVPGHACYTPEALASIAEKFGMSARTADNPEKALQLITEEANPDNPPIIALIGSLYLAGSFLDANRTPPE
ncbi:MAG: folylpolyglutamate synthase/dihydrofolate synthase family protein [Zymomonas mobilis subsp. pomaceae]|uniref:bifunctional folylpolyglutamate synthase/dihydrofolate synthase n=1 Tax=Zymomonas mobilis TaxID=542 RepID=UPI0039E7E801